jgi:hypothetical protein
MESLANLGWSTFLRESSYQVARSQIISLTSHGSRWPGLSWLISAGCDTFSSNQTWLSIRETLTGTLTLVDCESDKMDHRRIFCGGDVIEDLRFEILLSQKPTEYPCDWLEDEPEYPWDCPEDWGLTSHVYCKVPDPEWTTRASQPECCFCIWAPLPIFLGSFSWFADKLQYAVEERATLAAH